MRTRLAKSGLLNIADRLDAGERLALADGVQLFECEDLLAVGWLANRARESRHKPAHTSTITSDSKRRMSAWLVVYFAPSRDSNLAMRMPTR